MKGRWREVDREIDAGPLDYPNDFISSPAGHGRGSGGYPGCRSFRMAVFWPAATKKGDDSDGTGDPIFLAPLLVPLHQRNGDWQ